MIAETKIQYQAVTDNGAIADKKDPEKTITNNVILGKDSNNPRTEIALAEGYDPFTPPEGYFVAYVGEDIDDHFIGTHGIYIYGENDVEIVRPLRMRIHPKFLSSEAQEKLEKAEELKIFHLVIAASKYPEMYNPVLVGFIQRNGKPVQFGEFKDWRYYRNFVSANGNGFLIHSPF